MTHLLCQADWAPPSAGVLATFRIPAKGQPDGTNRAAWHPNAYRFAALSWPCLHTGACPATPWRGRSTLRHGAVCQFPHGTPLSHAICARCKPSCSAACQRTLGSWIWTVSTAMMARPWRLMNRLRDRLWQASPRQPGLASPTLTWRLADPCMTSPPTQMPVASWLPWGR